MVSTMLPVLLVALSSLATSARFGRQPNVGRSPNVGRPSGYGKPKCQFRYGTWGACTATCGAASQSRLNSVYTPNAPGCPALVETRPCQLGPCLLSAPQLPPSYGARFPPAPRARLPPAIPPRTYGGAQIEPQPQPDNSKYPVDCERLDDGLVPDPSNKCSHDFYFCSNGVTFKRSCAGHLYFDSESEACEQYNYVPACSGNRRPPTTPVPPQPYTPAPELDCTRLEDGLHVDPVQECSQRYFVCSHGETSEMACPGKTYFDAQEQSCRKYVQVFACTGKQYVEPDHSIDNDHKVPEPVDFDCSQADDGSYADPLEECSARYFDCVGGIGYERPCPGKTFFDDEFKVCDSFNNIPVCSGKPRPPPPPGPGLSSSYVITITFKDQLPYGANTEELRYAIAKMLKVRPDQITRLTRKSPSELELTTRDADVAAAARALAGEAAAGRLVLSHQYNNYFVLSITVRVVSLDEPSKPVYDFNCKGKYDGNYEAGDCEPYFWVCNGGVTERMACPGSTKFDPTLDQCENDEHVPGCGGVPRTPPPPTTPASLLPPVYDCEQKSDGHYLPEPCSGKYYTCSNGEAYENDCPGDTKFDLEQSKCEFAEKVPACGHTGYGGKPLTTPPPVTYGQGRPQAPAPRARAPGRFVARPQVSPFRRPATAPARKAFVAKPHGPRFAARSPVSRPAVSRPASARRFSATPKRSFAATPERSFAATPRVSHHSEFKAVHSSPRSSRPSGRSQAAPPAPRQQAPQSFRSQSFRSSNTPTSRSHSFSSRSFQSQASPSRQSQAFETRNSFSRSRVSRPLLS